MHEAALCFFKSLIAMPSPSGFEQPVAELHRDYVKFFAHKVTTDVLGDVSAVLKGASTPSVRLKDPIRACV